MLHRTGNHYWVNGAQCTKHVMITIEIDNLLSVLAYTGVSRSQQSLRHSPQHSNIDMVLALCSLGAVLSRRRHGSPQLLIDRAVQHPSELLPQSCQACAINCGKLPGFLQVLIERSAERTKLLSICGFHTMLPVNIATERSKDVAAM